MILFIIDVIAICYLLFGLMLWITPTIDLAGIHRFGFEDYNILFIAFWPFGFNDRIVEAISR